MEWMNIILGIVGAVLLGFAISLGKMIGGLLKGALNNIKHQGFQQEAWVLVRSEEKLFEGSRRGTEKLNFVYARLAKKFPWASNAKLGEFIKATVQAMHAELGNGESSHTAL